MTAFGISVYDSISLQPPPNTWTAFSLALIASWLRSWIFSGCAIETLLLLSGPAKHYSVPRSALVVALNGLYVLASTSWLFHLAFAALCWPLVGVTLIIQCAAVSSFTRGRLRSWLKLAHFYRDKVAFFHLPSLVIDSDLDGLVTIRGLTFSILDLSIQLHGIELGMDLGSGHEISVHSDAIKIDLFRQITIDEVYGVHWFTGSSSDPDARNHRADSHTENHLVNTHSPQSKKDTIKEEFFPSVEEAATANDQDAARDHVLPRTHEEWQETKSEIRENPSTKARLPSRSDIEAEQRYDDVLLKLRQSNRLYQSRARVRIANRKGNDQTDVSRETRAAVCADLRNTRPPMSPPSSRIAVSKLISICEPITRFLDKVPIVLRVFLWLLTQSHPVTCPSICFSACGAYLGDELLNKLVRRHTGGDNRIEQLKDEVSFWLSAADVYLDVTRLRGRGSVPLRTTNEIRTEIRSADVFVTRIGPKRESIASDEADDNTGRVAQFKGVDSTFHIPICLLPSHAYLAPLPESSEQDDTAPIFMAIRGSLPAHFSQSFLSFATTLSKTSQMLDIEEEAGRAGRDTDHIVPCKDHAETPHEHDDTSHSHAGSGHSLHGFRAKVAHGRIGAAMKHPIEHGKQILHKEVKKTAVDKVDGAWFAKWTNKLLEKLEGLDGDVGYSTEIQTRITR